LEILEALLVFVAGIASGFLNTVAGGGSLISLPLLIFLGLPSADANGTNRVAIFVQNIFAVGGFKSKGVSAMTRYSLYLSISALVGAVIGAKLAVDIRDEVFNRILAVIMVAVVLSTVFNPVKAGAGTQERMEPRHQWMGVGAFFLLGIYGGFIQAGIGFLIIAALSFINRFGLVKINSIKVLVALVYTGVALLVFWYEGKINWYWALFLSLGNALGAWVASRWSVSKGDKWIKRFLVVTVIALAVKLWFF
jgi:uncharacterized protein